MAEVLTKEIAKEYLSRARSLPTKGLQDIGERRELRIELQKRCGITELMAVNIVNGFHILDYVAIEQRKAKEQEQEKEV